MKKIIIKTSMGDYEILGDTIISSPTFPSGMKKAIGVGSLSSFDDAFTDEKIIVQSGFGDIRYAKIGDINDAIIMLKEKLALVSNPSFEEICDVVFEIVNLYFGQFDYNIKKRLDHYPTEDDIEDEDTYGKISDLKGTNSAMCVERAALSQNLFRSIGINSIFKSSKIKINGKNDAHAYNLIENNGKYFIYDSTIPTVYEERISPIICEIPEEVFKTITMPLFNGYSVDVQHYNPIKNKDVIITYDSDRENSYTVSQNLSIK